MAYTPKNVANYLAALAGAAAGMAASAAASGQASPTPTVYATQVANAEQFAEELDTLWGTAGDSFSAAAFQAASAMAFRDRQPSAAFSAGNWASVAAAVKAVITQAYTVLTAVGITPPTATTGVAPTFVAGSAAPPVATSQTVAAPTTVTAGPSGRITWIAVMSLSNAGGTAANSDVMQLQAEIDGVPVSGLLAQQALEAGVCSLTVIGSQGGLVPGSAHTPGAVATDTTNAAHTFTWGSASMIYWAT